jgi:hypothetical protein
VMFPQDFNLSYILLGETRSSLKPEVLSVVDEPSQARLKKQFLDKKSEIYALLNTLNEDPDGAATMKLTLDAFFRTLN